MSTLSNSQAAQRILKALLSGATAKLSTAPSTESGECFMSTIRSEIVDTQVENESLLEKLRLELEVERADREEIEAELSELNQNSTPAATLSEKLTPDAATILSQLRAKRKKSKTDLADLEAILEILES
jgi:ABC-type transporter Mla subunit MlaD